MGRFYDGNLFVWNEWWEYLLCVWFFLGEGNCFCWELKDSVSLKGFEIGLYGKR